MLNVKGYVCIGACLLASLSTPSAWSAAGGSRSRTSQLIIQLDGSAGRNVQSVIAGESGALDIRLPDGRSVTVLRQFDGNSLVVKLPEELTLEETQEIARQMADRSGIAAVYPDKRYLPALVPNDTLYSDPDPAVVDQWYLFESVAGIRMPTAWDLQTGLSTTVVAVIDTGIINHADMDPGRQINGYDFYSDAALDNDGSPGRDNDATDPGDWAAAGECGPGEPATDSSWHGLLVSSLIAATSNNSFGIAGVDFATRLLHIRALGKCGGNLSDVADAVRWAAGLSVAGAPVNSTPADVINLSLSGSGACSQPEQDAINAAVAAGSVVVVAGGNEGGNVASVSPANCNNVIAVGAIDRSGNLVSYTNTGLAIDLTAPGGDSPTPNGILVLSNTGTTTADASPAGDIAAETRGTSFTAAQASGVAALMLAENPGLSPGLLEDVMKASTRVFPTSSCDRSLCGTGVLDATSALQLAFDPSAVVSNQAPTADPGGPYSSVVNTQVQFDGSLSTDPENAVLSYSWDFGDGSFGVGVNATHTYTTAGTYTAALVVNDGLEDSLPVATTVTVSSSGSIATTSGGGGCVMADTGRFDPIWLLYSALAGIIGLRRRVIR